MATGRQGADERRHRVLVRLVDDEILEGWTSTVDLDRPDFELLIEGMSANSRSAIIPLASVSRILMRRDAVSADVSVDTLDRVAVHLWGADILKGHLPVAPVRGLFGMSLELLDPATRRSETYVVPHHAVKAVFTVRAWDSRPPQLEVEPGGRHWALPRRQEPLVDLLGEIRSLRGLRNRGQISAVEYDRRRQRVLARI